MMKRRVIGRFKRSKQGGWEGEIDTLTIQKRRIRLVPNDNRTSDNAPAFRVMLGWEDIGEAWEKQSRSDPPRDYLRVRMDDPFCPNSPISAVLWPDAEGLKARLMVNAGEGHPRRTDGQTEPPGNGR